MDVKEQQEGQYPVVFQRTASDYEIETAEAILMKLRREDQELRKGYFESIKRDIEEKNNEMMNNSSMAKMTIKEEREKIKHQIRKKNQAYEK